MKRNSLNTFFTPLILLCTSLLFAQDYSFKNYDWNENETKIEIPEQYKNEKEVILQRTTKIEIVVANKKVNRNPTIANLG